MVDDDVTDDDHDCRICGPGFHAADACPIAHPMSLEDEQHVLEILNSWPDWPGWSEADGFGDFDPFKVFEDDDGWRVEVFNDCDSWDYVEAIVAPDGRRWVFAVGDEERATQLALPRSIINWQPGSRFVWPDYLRCEATTEPANQPRQPYPVRCLHVRNHDGGHRGESSRALGFGTIVYVW